MRRIGGDGMRFLGKVVLIVLLCASGAWPIALLWAWLSNGEVEPIKNPWAEKPRYVSIQPFLR